MDFVKLMERIRNMLAYGNDMAEMHDQLVTNEGVSEDMFFFAYQSVLMESEHEEEGN